ncbi:MAG: hypothetical protein O3A51_09000, partial [Verrucomicrobia bacterium]|nr:hypothetical protein [Verrucomicrobiota bacterium]
MTINISDDALSLLTSDPVELIEFCYRQGWTDGLPVVPPLPKRVGEMLEAGGREPSEVMGFVNFVRRKVTVEKVAINAVMAGCRPDYFPVVLACVEAMLENRFGLHLAAASTHSPAIMPIINGPIRKQLDVNSGKNAFSPGWRANATIGRSLRLILMNVLGYSPRYFDNGTMGNPAKYSYCVGEYEEVSPWEPLHVERGSAVGTSAVTLFTAEPPRQTSSRRSRDPEVILLSVADMIATVGTATSRPDEEGFLIVVSPEHAGMMGAAGWTKRDVKQYLFEKSHRPLVDFKRAMRLPGAIEPGDEGRMMPM